jgi:hypothetical protein
MEPHLQLPTYNIGDTKEDRLKRLEELETAIEGQNLIMLNAINRRKGNLTDEEKATVKITVNEAKDACKDLNEEIKLLKNLIAIDEARARMFFYLIFVFRVALFFTLSDYTFINI